MRSPRHRGILFNNFKKSHARPGGVARSGLLARSARRCTPPAQTASALVNGGLREAPPRSMRRCSLALRRTTTLRSRDTGFKNADPSRKFSSPAPSCRTPSACWCLAAKIEPLLPPRGGAPGRGATSWPWPARGPTGRPWALPYRMAAARAPSRPSRPSWLHQPGRRRAAAGRLSPPLGRPSRPASRPGQARASRPRNPFSH